MDSIIFDVDGTLWDSTEIVADAWTRYLKEERHINMDITAEKLKSLFGQLLPQIAAKLFPEFSEEQQLSIIDGCCEAEHRALEKEKAPIYPGLEETLSALSKKYPLFIVSNCQAGYIEVFLKATHLGHYFSGHLCPGDTGMPKGDNILKIIQDYKLSSPVYVGDTAGDYSACRQANIPFVFASYGFGYVENPDYTISELKDLISLFS